MAWVILTIVLTFALFFFSLSCNTEEEEGTDASSLIPLDDGVPVDFGAIEVVQCLIEHHNSIFTDANETIWK